MNFGLVSLDQEKAFDRVDHEYLFNVMFGIGKSFGIFLEIYSCRSGYCFGYCDVGLYHVVDGKVSMVHE